MLISGMGGYFFLIFSGIIAVFILALVILFFIGNYFLNYALKRNDSYPEAGDRNVSLSTPSEYRKVIENRLKLDQISASNWAKNSNKKLLSIISNDGLRLESDYFIQENESHKYAIVLHGYSQNRGYVLDIAHEYYNRGYNVITPDLRGHGNSEGKYLGMGWQDREDILLWIDKIVSSDLKSDIIIHGISMGAAAVVMVSGEKMPSNVKAMIEDCGYTSLYEIFELELRTRFNLPAFPILDAADFVSRLRANYSIKEGSGINQIKKNITPMLFIHGCYDNFVPAEMAYRLYDACASQKEMLIMEEAGRNESRYLDHDKYYKKTFEFIDKYIHQ